MPFEVLSARESFLLTNCSRSPALPAGMHVTRNQVIYPKTGAAYCADTSVLNPLSITRRGPFLRHPPGIEARIDQSRLGTGSSQTLESAVLLPLPMQGANHFGHCITEVIAILYPLSLESGLLSSQTTVFVEERSWRKSSNFHSQINCLFNPVVINSGLPAIHVSKLLVPTPTLYLKHSVSIAHGLALKSMLPLLFGFSPRLSAPQRLPGVDMRKKVYLSRSKLPAHQRRIINEGRLERLLVKSGWEIVHLQTHSIPRQLCILSEARLIAGALGSAFHLLQYLQADNVKDKTILGLGVNREHFSSYALQFSSQRAKFLCLMCLRRPAGKRKPNTPPINQDLIIDKPGIAETVEWLNAY